MTAVQMNRLMLADVIEKLHLVRTKDPVFFPEWREGLTEITDQEQAVLNQIASDWDYLSEQVMDEGSVKLVIIGRLLALAGFYQPPFRLVTEKAVEISGEDEGVTFRGVVDILALHDQVWVLLVEAKHNRFSLEPALPQALAYMSGAPYPDYPTFGLVTNGQNFLFLKMFGQTYGASKEYVMRNEGDLAQVLQVMRRLAAVVRSWAI
jgi:hypothetical protein